MTDDVCWDIVEYFRLTDDAPEGWDNHWVGPSGDEEAPEAPESEMSSEEQKDQ